MEAKPWKYSILADWDIPLHVSKIESILLFRSKEVKGCENLRHEELIFETKDLEITEYLDQVEGPGLWAYAAYSKDEKGKLTLCATNYCEIPDTLSVTVNSEHGEVFGTLRGFEGDVLEIELITDFGYVFEGWTSDDYTFDDAQNERQSIILMENITITANFSTAQFELIVRSGEDDFGDPTGEVDLTVNGFHDYGSTVQLSAVNTEAYTFDFWFGDVSDPISNNTEIEILNEITEIIAFFNINSYSFNLGAPTNVQFALEDNAIVNETVILVEDVFGEFEYGEEMDMYFYVSEEQDADDEYIFRYRSDEHDGDYEGIPKYKIDSFLYLDENGVDIKDQILDLEEEYDEEYGEYYIYFTLTKNFTVVPVISNYNP